ncbi:hypothetical protein BS50DRAFT_618603 [Corynespora cassiicola Philippines]|uniref:Gylcosyl hydrolase 115 C-terminal domain-containing protein n=1 Tax=Corynespora cassiicola Philippines TaxID=1448308 RepID=A0A2T2NVX6_CORCC|nr:hypothetical protein BS50DRAFT_618603 [Corynespora cassiicola Philippines]
MFDSQITSFTNSPGSLKLHGTPILVDPDDYEGIHIAACNLASDLKKVTGHWSHVWEGVEEKQSYNLIVVGSLQRSRFVQELSQSETTGASRYGDLRGKWESFQTSVQSCPWRCSERMLVVAGSDKRGTIFGCYTLSEQIGVSPWYWWADVHIRPQPCVFALPITTFHGEPSVQYRGIFINDEAPALTDWVHEKFGPKYNSEFYKKVFELLLRLKANFLWPAMWSGFPEPGSIFFTDDPLNQQLADKYGIVISTSHHEPMGCNMSEWRASGNGEWIWESNKSAISEYFSSGAKRSKPFESLLTLGMRGDSDVSIISEDPKATLKDVIDAQRRIIDAVYGSHDGVGQVMALYKEVQEYYEDGLEIPDDVTLLFADDNFGNIRRYPTNEERSRRGGAGVYYHLEYVGTPRSYKWLNSNSCGKLHHQLTSAWDNGIRKIWVFNVGDIKPQELPLTFALSLAWNVQSIRSWQVPDFLRTFSTREFGSEKALDIANLLLGHDRLVALRRHEHIEPDTFSILNYGEADDILQRFISLEKRADELFGSVDAPQKASFFQLVLHPLRASRINTELRILQAQNRLHGLQRRNSTNVLAKKCLQVFEEDWELAETFHDNGWTEPNDKWNHIMQQPHYGYSSKTWHAPSRDMVTGISFVQRRQSSTRIAGQMGVMVEGQEGVRPGIINEESDRTHPSRGDLVSGLTLPKITRYGAQRPYFEIYSRGTTSIDWTATVPYDWIKLSKYSGQIFPDDESHRIHVTIDWSFVPSDFNSTAEIDLRAASGEYEQVHLPVTNHASLEKFRGFPEADRYISIEASAALLRKDHLQFYEHLPYLGRTSAGSISLERQSLTLHDKTAETIPWMEYPLYTFSELSEVKSGLATVWMYFTMTLDPTPGQPLLYDIALDGTLKQNIRLIPEPHTNATTKMGTLEGEAEDTVGLPAGLPEGWLSAVQDNVWIRSHEFDYTGPGPHLLRLRLLEKGLILEKVVVDFGGMKRSYLGPPPTVQL